MRINPLRKLEGSVFSSPSKSYSHRALALSLNAKSPSFLINPLLKGDVGVTMDFCRAYGAQILEVPNDSENIGISVEPQETVIKVIPPKNLQCPESPINGGNSGTSIRIMSALAGLVEGSTKISGIFFEKERPIAPLLDALAQVGIQSETATNPSGVTITPQSPMARNIDIPGDISSQFITGLLCLAPKFTLSSDHRETKINLTTPAKSYPYLQITEEIMTDFGIQFQANFDSNLQGGYIVPAGQNYSGIPYRVPGDFSSAAFILAAAALNPFPETITIKNLNPSSIQGDRAIIDILKRMGAAITTDQTNQTVTVTGGEFLEGKAIDCSQTPDLFPILCVLGVFARQHTRIFNAQHVRIKETDRIAIMIRELRKMGVEIREYDDGIEIEGPQHIRGGLIDHENDHRIAMAMSVAALFARTPSELTRPEIVQDSYPNFYSDLKSLGAEIENDGTD